MEIPQHVYGPHQLSIYDGADGTIYNIQCGNGAKLWKFYKTYLTHNAVATLNFRPTPEEFICIDNPLEVERTLNDLARKEFDGNGPKPL